MGSKLIGIKNHIADLFVDREFFMRSNGQIKFLKISAKLQRLIATILALVLLVWVLATLFMAANQYSVSIERMALVKKEARIQSKAERVAAYKKDMDAVADDLSKRQDLIEATVAPFFNDADISTKNEISEKSELVDKVGALAEEAAYLARVETRQIAFAKKVTKIAQTRAKRAEAEIRKFGLSPRQFAQSESRGGPFIPFFDNDRIEDPRFTKMAEALEYMKALENGLASIPSAMPAETFKLSSSFGYRRDPFNGRGAMHSGLDFKAAYGTPILAAADGVITKSGWMGGYGKTIEISHGNGLMTRYAHMSRLNVTTGQKVERGVQIGKMGSTGRSTGTHLHFEVRHNGRAINPHKFLKANPNVLKNQAKPNTSTKK